MSNRTTCSTRIALAYKPKPVQGLYSYSHFEASDGSWIQIPLDKLSDIVFCPSDSEPFVKGASLHELEPTILTHMDAKGL